MRIFLRTFCCIFLTSQICLPLTAQDAIIGGDLLDDRPSDINILQALAGNAAGVEVISTSGRPGGAPLLLIRGVGSVNGESTPLYVVDGAEGVDPQSLNIDDIDKIVVLKDGAATALYGVRGANGVVVITTKSGKDAPRQGTVSYSGSVGAGVLTRRPALMNSSQYLDMQLHAYDFSGTPMPRMDNFVDYKVIDAELKMIPKYDTDWWDESTRTAVVNRHNLSFSQSGDNSTVYASLGWQDVQGVVLGTGASRLSGTVNASSKISDWLDIRGLVTYSRTGESLPDNEGSAFGALSMMYEMPPLVPVKYENGTWGAKSDVLLSGNGSNPVQQLTSLKNNTSNDYFLGNLGLDFHLSSELTLTLSGNYRTVNYKNTDFRPDGLYYWSNEDTGNHAYITYANSWNWGTDDYLTWRHDFASGALRSEFTAGGAWHSSSYYSDRLGAQQMSTGLFEHYNLGAGTKLVQPISDQYDYNLWSLYARTTQILLGRYVLTAGIRRDTCSLFEDDLRSCLSPFVAAKWKLASEPWMASARNILGSLDLRASYGAGGNLTGFASVWERSTGIDAGFDMALNFAGLTISADWYSRKTTCRPDTGSVLSNSGVEVTLGASPVATDNFRWDINAIFYTNNCRLASYEGDAVNHGGAVEAGEELARWKMRPYDGVWKVSEIADAVIAGSRPGNYKLGEEVYLGSALPKGNASLANNFNLSGFNLYIDLSAAWGFKVANLTKAALVTHAIESNSLAEVPANSWTTDNQDAAYARLRLPTDTGFGEDCGSLALEKGDYLRIRTIALSYDLKRSLLKNFEPAKSVVAGITVENPLILTGYSGLDPEVGAGTYYTGIGYDFYSYPRPMTITGNIKLIF
ncbi:MAG: TonB-dependent receptor plug domain-containing protein [Bacteroidales bacterium]|nr:TonB-dependent receptor plug domain-containing protein [Bacteroidales bacterium]